MEKAVLYQPIGSNKQPIGKLPSNITLNILPTANRKQSPATKLSLRNKNLPLTKTKKRHKNKEKDDYENEDRKRSNVDEKKNIIATADYFRERNWT